MSDHLSYDFCILYFLAFFGYVIVSYVVEFDSFEFWLVEFFGKSVF